jgi:hypothetical protein
VRDHRRALRVVPAYVDRWVMSALAVNALERRQVELDGKR